MNTIGIIGAGSFGTALEKILQDNGNNVLFYVRTPRNLPNTTTSMDLFFSSCQLIIIAIPVENIPTLLSQIKNFIKPHHSFIHCIKGLINTTNEEVLTVSEFIKKELKHNHVGCLSGPNLATEIKNSQLTSAIIASDAQELTKFVKYAMHNEKFIILESQKLIDVELCGVLKNIIALASGILNGLGEGDNAKSLLMTLGMMEIFQIAKMIFPNADEKIFYGIAGLGDLVATCSSSLSRNFSLGNQIAHKEKLENINYTAEGVKTTFTIYNLALKKNRIFPITFAVYKILFKNDDPKSLIKVLREKF